MSRLPPRQEKQLREQLAILIEEHENLQKTIDSLKANHAFDVVSLMFIERKQKSLKDHIKQIESLLLGDIIA
jgi:hypothetical protein